MADITQLAVQKVTKPNIENVLPYYLDGETLESALDLIAYLRENKMKPSWTIHNAWKAVNKGKVLYYIRLPVYESHFYRPNQACKTSWEHSWCITPYLTNLSQYEHLITDEVHKKIILDNLYGCKPYCPKTSCWSETTLTVFDKKLERYCGGTLKNRSLWIVNPDETEIVSIKKFLALEKQARTENSENEK